MEIQDRDDSIKSHLQNIESLEAKIRALESKLELAMQSGDEATKKLRDQITQLTEELEKLKIKSKKEFEDM